MCSCDHVDGPSPLIAFGKLDTCRGVMRAYRLYLYQLYKEKYENYGRQN